MLQKLRDQSSRWYIKALFVLLVVSFGMWGVADILLNYVNMRPVATVNGHNITQEEFGARLQNIMSRAQEASKGQLKLEQIKEMGIPKNILDSLIDQALLTEELKKYQLVVTDAAVRRRIQSIPAFLNEQGVFDKRAFDYLLHNSQITESQFISDLRSELQHHQLFGALIAGMHLPKTYVDLLFQGFFEQRVFAVVTVPFRNMVVKDTAQESDLKKFYQDNQAQFMLPEARAITLLEIDPTLLKDQIVIPQNKAQEEYDRRKSEFEIAERREVKQINCKDEKTANKVADSLKKGRLASDVAKDYAAEFKNWGMVAKQQLPDSVADRLFSSELGQVVGPVSTSSDSTTGWQVYVVSKIEPAYTKSFLEARAQLESELKTQTANDQIYEMKNKVEDALAGGATLSEIAKDHHLKVRVIESVLKSGNDLDGKSVLPEAGKADILEQAFSLAEKADSSTIDAKEGTSYVVHVDAIKPAHVPDFSAIKDKVLKAWMQQKRLELSLVVAQQLARDAHSVADLTRMAVSRKLSIKMLDPLSRVEAEKDEKVHKQLTPRLVSQMFELTTGKVAIGITPDQVDGGIQVVMLQKVLPFNAKSLKDKREQMEKKLAELVDQDASTLYVKSLHSKAKISINEAMYNTMVNRGA